jgi:hypothetical protein
MYRACLAVDVEQMTGADAGTAQCVVRHGQGKAVVAIGGQEAGMAGWSCVEQLSDFEIVRNQNNISKPSNFMVARLFHVMLWMPDRVCRSEAPGLSCGRKFPCWSRRWLVTLMV